MQGTLRSAARASRSAAQQLRRYATENIVAEFEKETAHAAKETSKCVREAP